MAAPRTSGKRVTGEMTGSRAWTRVSNLCGLT